MNLLCDFSQLSDEKVAGRDCPLTVKWWCGQHDVLHGEMQELACGPRMKLSCCEILQMSHRCSASGYLFSKCQG